MLSVVLFGTGNVARFLFDVLIQKDNVHVAQVVGRSAHRLSYFQEKVATTTDFSKTSPAKVYIIAVRDDAISSVAEQLKGKPGLVVHTSGSVPITDLPNTVKRGVLYPLQTFSKGQILDFGSVPLCLEAESGTDLKLLRKLAGLISDQVYEIDSKQRKQLHLAAVFANNFTNHLYHLAQEICEEGKVPFHLLKPLISETVKKIDYISPFNAQTGPAKRNDIGTIERHINMLKNQNQKNIYRLLSSSIQDTYGKEL